MSHEQACGVLTAVLKRRLVSLGPICPARGVASPGTVYARSRRASAVMAPNNASASHEPSCRNTDEYNDPEQEAINHERPSRELLQDSHQSPDGKKRRNRGHNQSKEQHGPPVTIEVNFVKLPHLFEARQGDSRQSKKKRQSCRRRREAQDYWPSRLRRWQRRPQSSSIRWSAIRASPPRSARKQHGGQTSQFIK